MAFDIYETGRHTVLSAVPDFLSKRNYMGFLVILPGTVQDDELLEYHISRLQRKGINFPDELVKDILSEDQSPEIVIELSKILNTGNDPEVINFVYFPSIRRDDERPKIAFDAAVVATRGYDGIGLPLDFSMLYREGQPVVGVGTLSKSGRKVISDERMLTGLQDVILKEFSHPLSSAERPHFVLNGMGYTNVLVNPVHAYKLLERRLS